MDEMGKLEVVVGQCMDGVDIVFKFQGMSYEDAAVFYEIITEEMDEGGLAALLEFLTANFALSESLKNGSG